MWRSPTAFTAMSMRECRAKRSSIWSKKPIPVATLDTPDPSRSTVTSISVSLVLRLMVAVRMKTAFLSRKRGPFNRPMGPSLLRGGGLEAELQPMVTGIRRWPYGLTRFLDANRDPARDQVRGHALREHAPDRADCNPSRQSLNPCQREVFMQTSQSQSPVWHGTTILTVRKGGRVVIGGDGQVSIGQTVIKSNAKKVRKLGKGDVIGGFAGATADAFTLFERLESKLEQYPGQLTRAAVELAKDWRTDRYLRRLEAMMIVADKDVSLVLTGTGDVLEPEAGVMAIGSGGNYALAAARALVDSDKDAETIVRRALDIAADICVYTNRNVTIESLQNG